MKLCPVCDNGNGLWRYNQDALTCKRGHLTPDPECLPPEAVAGLRPAEPISAYVPPAPAAEVAAPGRWARFRSWWSR